MQHTRKALSILLTLAMLLSLIPFTALPVQAGYEETPIVVASPTDLVAKVSEGGSIKLSADMEIDQQLDISKPLTLDLAGHTLTFKTDDYTALEVHKGGSLVLNDSSEGKTGKITTNTSYVIFSYASEPEYGNITINGGTVETTSSSTSAAALYIGGHCITVKINGGKLISKEEALRSYSNVDITGGVFDGELDAYGNNAFSTQLNITGGYFKNVDITNYTVCSVTGGYFEEECMLLSRFPTDTYTLAKTTAADGEDIAGKYLYKVIPISNAHEYNIVIRYYSDKNYNVFYGTEGCKLKAFLNNYSHLKNPTKYDLDESYYFDGFYYDAEYKNPVSEDDRLTKETTIYVKFVPIPSYTVTVKYNLEGIPDSTKKVLQEQAAYVTFESLNLSRPNPEQYGIEGDYIFEGYYTDPEYKNPIDLDSTITNDTTIYGKFVPYVTHTVTVNYNGHGGKTQAVIKNVGPDTPLSMAVLLALQGETEYSSDKASALFMSGLSSGDMYSLLPSEEGWVLPAYGSPRKMKAVSYGTASAVPSGSSVYAPSMGGSSSPYPSGSFFRMIPNLGFYGLKASYDSWADFYEEMQQTSSPYITEDTTVYLQWAKLLDEVTLKTSKTPVCGDKIGDFTVTLPDGQHATLDYSKRKWWAYDHRCAEDELFQGGKGYELVDIELIADYGYAFNEDTNLICAEANKAAINAGLMVNAVSRPAGSDAEVEAECYLEFVPEHAWGDWQDMTDEEAADAMLTKSAPGRTWQKRVCTKCTDADYREKAAPGEDTYTVTIDMGGHGENVTITGALKGYELAHYLSEYMYDRSPTAKGYRFIGFAPKPVSEYSSLDVLQEAISDFMDSPLTGDVTAYAIWFTEITPEIIFNSVPVCGDKREDHPTPDVSVPEGAHYKLNYIEDEGKTYLPFGWGDNWGNIDDCFSGSNSEYGYAYLKADFGYSLSREAAFVCSDSEAYMFDSMPYTDDVFEYDFVLKIPHRVDEDSYETIILSSYETMGVSSSGKNCMDDVKVLTALRCSACHSLIRETLATKTVPSQGHDWSRWEDNGNGTQTRTCEYCGETQTRDIGTGHYIYVSGYGLTASSEKAEKGETVTVTADVKSVLSSMSSSSSPAMLMDLTDVEVVVDAFVKKLEIMRLRGGEESTEPEATTLEVTKNADGSYSFVMPDDDVVVHGIYSAPKPEEPKLPESGKFAESKTVSIDCPTLGAAVFYTTDGSDPATLDNSSEESYFKLSDTAKRYVGPFTVTDTTTVKAVALYPTPVAYRYCMMSGSGMSMWVERIEKAIEAPVPDGFEFKVEPVIVNSGELPVGFGEEVLVPGPGSSGSSWGPALDWSELDSAVKSGFISAVTTATYTYDPNASEGGGHRPVNPSGPVSGGGTTETPKSGETVTNNDGSKTETKTNADGSKTETTTKTDGSKTETTTAKDGSAVTENTASDGSTGTVKTDAEGNTVSAEAKVSEKAVEEAAKAGESIKVQVEVKAAASAEKAAPVTVTLPKTEKPVRVEIPVENVTASTVAVIVYDDGREEIVKTSTTGEDGVVLSLEGSATVKIVDNAKDFGDVKADDWFASSVAWAASHEVMNGVGGGSFEPNADTSRGMIAQLLFNLDGAEASGDTAAFKDVAADDWFAGAVTWMVDAGIAKGQGESFGANDSVTREQLAVMLYNYAQHKGYDTTAQGDVSSFGDADGVSDYAKDALAWAVGVGLINGTTDKDGNIVLDAQGSATRAQVAAIMERFCDKVAK